MSSFPFNQEESDTGRGVDPAQVGEWAPEQSPAATAGQGATGETQLPVGVPSIDVVDTDEEIIAYVDLPGFEADDVRVRVDGQTLVVDATREGEIEDTDTVLLTERPQSVERVVTLPTVVRAGGAEAELSDGVCMISLPKAANDRFEEIRVTSD
ncbi:Hsp20/alpha crystallin family protein [Halobaculum marinum]|uniref:Hsp20/alpha crystallin family protein n=1 Tax=Halobaculum marinum TaxID=3031996 RepID=A0ABD5X2T2_9EURY|nr:Hsp20/alpha crystallin family protein [Halobaculum sp. DT55]